MSRRGGGRRKTGAGGRKDSGGFRIPSVVMIPVGLAVGWFVASWPGAILGGVVGIFLWRSRA